MKPTKLLFLLGASALVLAALPATAATITAAGFQSTIPAGASDKLTVYNSDGIEVGNATTLEKSEPANTLREVNTDLASPAFIGDYYLIFEPDGTTLSDIVGVEHATNPDGSAHAEFAYISDPLTLDTWVGAGKRFDGVSLGSLNEGLGGSGIILDISALINPTGGAAGGTAYFFSDGNPDGGLTVALLGFALVGVEGLRRKLRK